MEEGTDKNGFERDQIFSKAVRAGKRTYFFDVKSTKQDELYLTVTESKKRMNDDGKFVYDKHKIFLYKEDFEKFLEGLNETVGYIKANSPEIEPRKYEERTEWNNKPAETKMETKTENETPAGDKSFTDVNFEDLDK